MNPDRPLECCPGLECQFAKCVNPDSIATCAPQGEKALECGVNQPNRPDKCCEGVSPYYSSCLTLSFHVVALLTMDFAWCILELQQLLTRMIEIYFFVFCTPVTFIDFSNGQLICDALKTCSPIGEVPTAEPTVFVPPTPACAGVGERAQDCGAMNTARPQSCCGDLICGEGASVRCVDPNAPAPTAEAPTTDGETAPVAAPTAAAVEPTGVPTMSLTVEPSPDLGLDEPTGVPGTPEPTTEAPVVTSEPTMADDVATDQPTDADDNAPDPTPPSSASKMAAVTAAVAVVVAAPLLL